MTPLNDTPCRDLHFYAGNCCVLCGHVLGAPLTGDGCDIPPRVPQGGGAREPAPALPSTCGLCGGWIARPEPFAYIGTAIVHEGCGQDFEFGRYTDHLLREEA
jgi:hypothetical protein